MTQIAPTELCPKGHTSTEPDYCSECGARIGGAPAAESLATPGTPAPAFAGEVCPDCATLREQREIAFCEVCGFNFQTGARGEIPLPPAPPAPSAPLPQAMPGSPAGDASAAPDRVPQSTVEEDAPHSSSAAWSLTIEVDPALRSEGSPEAPSDLQPTTVVLSKPVNLIGRQDQARGILPDIDLTFDDAVSRRHALLQIDAATGQLTIRDIGASNGTRLNGTDLVPMVDHPLRAGDELTLGHWSRLRVQHG